MKRHIALVLALVLLSAASLYGASLQSSPTGRYVIVFKTQTLPADAATRIAKSGGTPYRLLSQVGVATALGNAKFVAQIAKDPKVQAVGAETLHSLPSVKMVEINGANMLHADAAGPTSADAYYFYQWDIRRIGAPAVWQRLPLSANVPTVAVLDTGVKHDHPDLAGQVTVMKSTAYCGTSGGSPVSPAYPAYSTLIDFDAYPSWEPGVDPCVDATTTYHSHGTHVAGTIASKFGGGGVVGVAPDAKIWAYKVFDRYRYTASDGLHDDVGAFDGPIFDAILDATENGAPVISMSLGSALTRADSDDNATWLAWDRIAKYANRRGTLIVASAGNDGTSSHGTLAHIPSDLSTVMSTSASGAGDLVVSDEGLEVMPAGLDVLAFYSNYGSAIDIAAPGGDCGPYTTCYPDFFILNAGIRESSPGTVGGNTYYWMIGTSMATPHVSAVAAWVRAIHPDWNPGMVRDYLKSTSQNIGPRQWFGAGMVDADAAAH